MIWTSFPSCLKSCLSLLALNSISFKLHHHLEDPSKQDRSDHATTAGHLLYVVYCDERVPIDLHRTLPYIKSFDRAYLGRMACRKLHCQLTTYKRSLSQPLVNCNGGKLEFIAYFIRPPGRLLYQVFL